MGHRFAALAGILLFAAAAAAGEPETVRFPTEDGLTIEADLHATGRTGASGVIALHMYASDRSAWAPLAERFREAGIDFFAIDLRGHGGSRHQKGEDLGKLVKARSPDHFRRMHRDALAAWRYLGGRGTDVDRVAFLGASVGCSVALDAAAREERIRGACLMTPGENYLGVPSMEHVKRWGDRPLLVLSSAEEAGKGARAIAAAVRSARLQVIPGYRNVHGTRMLGRVDGVETRLVGFFKRILGAPVAMDGTLSGPESAGTGATRTFRLGDYESRVQGRGDWLHVVLRRSKGGPLPDRFLFAAAPPGKPERARAVAMVRSAEGIHGQYLRFDRGGWMPVRRRPVRGAPRLRVAQGDVMEMLIPRGERAWFERDPHLLVAFAVGTGRAGAWTALSETSPESLASWHAWPGK
jgi:pimeloyl-ACP methyl ester carboxylesterase